MPVIGEVYETDPIDICNVTVAYPDGKGDTFSFDAPKGTAILSYHAVERGKGGQSGYEFSVIGDNSVFVSADDVKSKFKVVFDILASDPEKEKEYKLKIESLQEEALRASQMRASTHSKLLCKWWCNHDGNDFDKRGGNLNLAFIAKLIRSLDTSNIDALIATIIDAIKAGQSPGTISPFYKPPAREPPSRGRDGIAPPETGHHRE